MSKQVYLSGYGRYDGALAFTIGPTLDGDALEFKGPGELAGLKLPSHVTLDTPRLAAYCRETLERFSEDPEPVVAAWIEQVVRDIRNRKVERSRQFRDREPLL